MSTTTVHNIKGRVAEFLADPLGVYIGRTGWYSMTAEDAAKVQQLARISPETIRFKGRRVFLVGGPWSSPHRVGPVYTREEVMDLYLDHLANRPALQRRAREELRGKHLYCWCVPRACHGSLLASCADSEPSDPEALFTEGRESPARAAEGSDEG